MKDKIKKHLEDIDNTLQFNLESFCLEQSFFMNECLESDLVEMKKIVSKINEIIESEMN
jgi:hypothetical protein